MTKQVKIGKINIGGGNQIAIQSMTNTPTQDIDKTVQQILDLEKAGCDIVRVAVLDKKDAKAISDIKLCIHIPLVADIHFDYLLALEAIKNGADKIRINPSNIGSEEKVLKIIDCAKSYQTSMRIGVNSGSIDKVFLKKYPDKTDALVNSLLSEVAFFEKNAFDNLVLSIKSSSVKETVEANRIISKLTSYPLHIGVTEAGVPEIGLIKNSIGIGSLLLEGIGDTLRVSLTCNPIEEVYAAKKILTACEKPIKGINFISCPTCGRCQVDMVKYASLIYEKIKNINTKMTVAVMGCAVNGPGEAQSADIGIAFGTDKALLFKNGKIVCSLPLENIVDTFVNTVFDTALSLTK